jgi:hypothetical protein
MDPIFKYSNQNWYGNLSEVQAPSYMRLNGTAHLKSRLNTTFTKFFLLDIILQNIHLPIAWPPFILDLKNTKNLNKLKSTDVILRVCSDA